MNEQTSSGAVTGLVIVLVLVVVIGALVLGMGEMLGAVNLPASSGGPDVSGAIRDGRATVAAGVEQLRSTERAREERRAQATLQAARTAQAAKVEIELLQARIESTRVAQELGFAAGDATEAAGVRGTLAAATATQQAGTALAATQQAGPTATLAAIEAARVIDLERRKHVIAVFWLYFWPVLGVVLLLGLIALLVLLSLRLFGWFLKWRTLQNSVRTPDGRLVWDVDGQLPSMVTSLRTLPLYRGDNEVRQLTPSGSVLSAPIQRGPATRQASGNHLAVQFLEQAVAVAGEQSRVLPGWRSMPGMSSSTWQQAVALLAEAGLVVPRVGVATYVADDYQDLGELLEKVETRAVRIIPHPGG